MCSAHCDSVEPRMCIIVQISKAPERVSPVLFCSFLYRLISLAYVPSHRSAVLFVPSLSAILAQLAQLSM